METVLRGHGRLKNAEEIEEISCILVGEARLEERERGVEEKEKRCRPRRRHAWMARRRRMSQ